MAGHSQSPVEHRSPVKVRLCPVASTISNLATQKIALWFYPRNCQEWPTTGIAARLLHDDGLVKEEGVLFAKPCSSLSKSITRSCEACGPSTTRRSGSPHRVRTLSYIYTSSIQRWSIICHTRILKLQLQLLHHWLHRDVPAPPSVGQEIPTSTSRQRIL